MAALFEGLEFIDWLRAALAGWRYLLSGSFRDQTHARWRQETTPRVIWDIVCGVAGIVFTFLVLYVVISLFARWDWLERLAAPNQPLKLTIGLDVRSLPAGR